MSVLNMLPMIFVRESDKRVIAFNLDLSYRIDYEILMEDNRLSALGYTLLRREIHKWSKTTPLPESVVMDLSELSLDQLLMDLETDIDGVMECIFIRLPKSRQQRYHKIETRAFCQYHNVGVNHHSLLLTREEKERLHVSIIEIGQLQYSFMAA